MAEEATGSVPSSRGEGESQLAVLNSQTSGKESETSLTSTQGDRPTGNHHRHHIHDAFGNGDIGVDYLFDEDPDENESGMDNEDEDHDEIVSAQEPTNRKEKQKVFENRDTPVTSNDENSFAKRVPVEELEEEVGLHEATLESLNAKLANLVSEIQLEEKRAGSLRDEIQNLIHRKTHLKKRKDYNVQLIKELENTLNKCLIRLRRVLNASKEVKIERDPGSCVSGVDSGGDQIALERESDNIDEEADLHFRSIADKSAIGPASANAVALDCSGENDYSVDAIKEDQNSKQLTYGEIPLLPCEKATRGFILWPAADLVKEIQSEVENLPCYFPAWRASELSGPLLSGIDSPDLAAKMMHISAIERQMERERLMKSDDSVLFPLPPGCGWVNERAIWGTSLDIYSQVNWRPLFSGFRRFGDKQKATCSVTDGIDPNTVLCPYELGGTCADNQCPYQHILDKNRFKGRKEMYGSIMFKCGKERYIRYHNLPDPVLPPPFLSPNKNHDSGNSCENALGNERGDVPSSLHRRSGRWKGRSDLKVSTIHYNEDIEGSPKKKKQKTYPNDLADNPGLNSGKNVVEQKCLEKRTYLCPTCATVGLDEKALRDHLQECKPNILVVEGEKVVVNNVLVRIESNSQEKSDYILEGSDNFATNTEHRFKREKISEFEKNDDFVSLLPFQDDNEEKITGNAEDKGGNQSSDQRLFGNEFWWQNIVPFAKLEGNDDDVGVFDSLLLSCGFKIGLSKLDKSRHSLEYIRPPQLRAMNNYEECEEVLLLSRLVDFSRTCIHLGRVSSAIGVLSNCKHTITFSMNKTLIEYALDSILQTSSGHSAYGSYRCQISLLVISEFCRDRYNSLCGKNTSSADTSFDVFTNYISYLLRPEQSILQDIAPAGIDHEEALRNITARVPSKRSTSQRRGARISQDSDSWTLFENALRLLFEDVLDQSFQKCHFSYLLRCLFMGHFLEELVSVVSHHEPTFSPCLHALDPLWRSVQRLVSASVGLFDQGFTCCVGPEIIALVIIGPVIFGCLNSTIAIALDTDEPDVSSDNSAPTLDARSIANLSSLDDFIVGVLKEIKTYRRPDGDGGLAAALIAPLWSISVTIPVSLGLFEKAQLRLTYAINLKDNSKFLSSKLSTLNLNALSGCLWSQLFDLRNCFPYYSSILGNKLNYDKSLLPSVDKIHSDISSRAFRNDVILRGVKMRGDKCTELINPLNRKELQKVASQIFRLHTSGKCEVLSCRDIYEEKHNDSFEVNFCGFSAKSNETPQDSVFPESFLLLGKSLKRLKITNFGLETLPLSLGYHLSRIISLNFAGNLLEEIPPSICHMTLLEEFDASCNRLRMLPKEIVQCVNLRFINVSNNQIHEFPGNLALDLPRLQTFVIDGNPALSVLRKS